MTPTVDIRNYAIDKGHSEAAFQVRHLITRVRGRFSSFEGAIRFDDSAPERSTVMFTIDAQSIDTSNADRDNHLRSNDFFAVSEHPTITFESSEISRSGEHQYDVRGQLTIRGITRDVTVRMTFLGHVKDPYGRDRIGFEGSLTINRKDFGLNWNAALESGGLLVGENVNVELSIQAVA